MDTQFDLLDEILAEFQLTTSDLNVSDPIMNQTLYSVSTEDSNEQSDAFFSSIDNSVNVEQDQNFRGKISGRNVEKLHGEQEQNRVEDHKFASSPHSSCFSSSPDCFESLTSTSNQISDESVDPSTSSTSVRCQVQRINPSALTLLSVPVGRNPESITLTFEQSQAFLAEQKNSTSILLNGNSSSIINQRTFDELINFNTKNQQYSPESRNKETSGKRKPSHNVIEKRYRSSINEKIAELKSLVAAKDGKIQKSAILRRTIEHIRQLQSANERLEEENGILKNILKRLNLTTEFNVQTSTKNEQHKQIDSTSTDDEESDHRRKRQKKTSSQPGMLNGSRLALCCFMFCILMTNPFNSILDQLQTSKNDEENSNVHSMINARTLKAINDQEMSNSSMFFSTSWKQIIGWLLNIAICCVCLIKIFVHGDPIVSDSDMEIYLKCRIRADQLIEQKKFNEARQTYDQCCEKLYAPLSSSWICNLSSVLWQIIRLNLNLIFVGRWLTYWSGWTRSIDTRDYNVQLNYCLLQRWKLEYSHSSSIVELMNLCLSTINTGITSGKKLNHQIRNEIILLTTMTLSKMNYFPSILIVFLLKIVKVIDVNDLCLLDFDRFHRFIAEENIDLFNGESMVDSIRHQYSDYLIYEDIENQLLSDFSTEFSVEVFKEIDRYSWWQHVLQLMRWITHENEKVDAFNSTIYRLARKNRLIDRRYVFIVATIHRTVFDLNDDEKQNSLYVPLAQISRLLTSMIDANQPKRLDSLHCIQIFKYMQWKKQCNKKVKNNDQISAIQTLLLDGILSLRLHLLTRSIDFNDPKLLDLDQFRIELTHYRTLGQWMKLPKHRFRLFDSIYRAVLGLNPLQIQTSFESSLKKVHRNLQSKNALNSDAIAALLIFCNSLPTAVFRYQTFFQQTLKSSTSNNDDHHLSHLKHRCSTIIQQTFLNL